MEVPYDYDIDGFPTRKCFRMEVSPWKFGWIIEENPHEYLRQIIKISPYEFNLV